MLHPSFNFTNEWASRKRSAFGMGGRSLEWLSRQTNGYPLRRMILMPCSSPLAWGRCIGGRRHRASRRGSPPAAPNRCSAQISCDILQNALEDARRTDHSSAGGAHVLFQIRITAPAIDARCGRCPPLYTTAPCKRLTARGFPGTGRSPLRIFRRCLRSRRRRSCPWIPSSFRPRPGSSGS